MTTWRIRRGVPNEPATQVIGGKVSPAISIVGKGAPSPSRFLLCTGPPPSGLAQERPAEHHRFVPDLDDLAEQVVGQASLAAVDPGPDLGPRPQFLVARQEVAPDRLVKADGHLDHVLLFDRLGLGGDAANVALVLVLRIRGDMEEGA